MSSVNWSGSVQPLHVCIQAHIDVNCRYSVRIFSHSTSSFKDISFCDGNGTMADMLFNAVNIDIRGKMCLQSICYTWAKWMLYSYSINFLVVLLEKMETVCNSFMLILNFYENYRIYLYEVWIISISQMRRTWCLLNTNLFEQYDTISTIILLCFTRTP